MLAIRLPPDIESRLESLAKTTGRTERDHVLTAIADYLDGIEDEAEARRRLADIKSGGTETILLDDVLKQ